MIAPVLPEADGARVEVLTVGEDTSHGLTWVELERRGTCGQIPGAGVGAAAIVTDDGSQGEENRRWVGFGGSICAGDKVRDGDRAVIGNSAGGGACEGEVARRPIGIRLFLDDDRAALGVGEGTDDVLTRVECDAGCA